jgi:phosphoribosylcarboxyaminoimidazole (NCAIR) mutase
MLYRARNAVRMVVAVGSKLRPLPIVQEAVAWFFECGLTVREVALISGHRDPRMLSRYTHLRPEKVAEKLAKATAN